MLLRAANEYYNTAMGDLPNNRDVAVSNLRKALDLLEQIVQEASKDSYQARAALIGKARCLEARNELAKAIEQYELVAKNWPDSPEAEQAKQTRRALKKPDAAAFYKELYAYSPPKVTLPPLGNEKLDFPGRSAYQPRIDDSPRGDPRPGGSDSSRHQRNQTRTGGALPANVFTPEKKAESKTPK